MSEEVENYTLHGQVQEYFHAYTLDPVTIMAAMTKWMVENTDKMVLRADLKMEYSIEQECDFYVGIIEWA